MRLIIRDALMTLTLTMAISIGLAAGAAQEHQQRLAGRGWRRDEHPQIRVPQRAVTLDHDDVRDVGQ